MKLAELLQVNEPNVVHETIDGEAILLDLNSGNYFSLDGPGAIIWDLIDKTGKWQDVISIMISANEAEKDNISETVQAFVAELVEENLLVERKADIVVVDTSEIENQLKEAIKTFTPPKVNKYSDMQDLLLLDPIHDVDDKGWPESNENQQTDPPN